MGMAASQARLLSITARIHDVEYQAQSIQNAKVQLATQSDQVYNEYMNALDAQMLTIQSFENGTKATIAATFNNLFSSNRVTPSDGSSYVLRNERGQLIVEDDVAKAYGQFKDNDAYAFAAYMLGMNSGYTGNLDDGSHTKSVHKHEEDVYQHHYKAEDNTKLDPEGELVQLHKSLEKMTGKDDIYDASNVPQDKMQDYEATLAEYRHKLYERSNFAEEICTGKFSDNDQADSAQQLMDKNEFNLSKFKYYTELFNTIRMCGGCVPVSDYNGMFGDAKNNSEWLTAMVQSGKFTIDTVSRDKSTGKYTLNGTSPSSDSCLSYTNVSSVDNTAVKKAEAKYEKDLKDIDKKDKQYDLTLSKLETERQALTTEYDSVKKVIQDNIDRTFGIFS